VLTVYFAPIQRSQHKHIKMHKIAESDQIQFQLGLHTRFLGRCLQPNVATLLVLHNRKSRNQDKVFERMATQVPCSAAGTLGTSKYLLVALDAAKRGSATAKVVRFAAAIEVIFWLHIEVAVWPFSHILTATVICTSAKCDIMSETFNVQCDDALSTRSF